MIDPRQQHRAAILYDPDCGFCCFSAALLLRLDFQQRLRPVPLGTPEADALLAPIAPERRAASWHLVEPDGKISSAGIAAVPLLQRLPAGAPLAAALGRFPAAVERAYQLVASNRDRFGRLLPRRSVLNARTELARRQP